MNVKSKKNVLYKKCTKQHRTVCPRSTEDSTVLGQPIANIAHSKVQI